MTNTQALDIITELIDSCKYDNGVMVIVKCITTKYENALQVIREELDRLKKLETAIAILKHNAFFEFNECMSLESDNFIYCPVAIKSDKDEVDDYTILNVGNKENYELLKEVLENE